MPPRHPSPSPPRLALKELSNLQGGEVIKALREETGASIRIGDYVTGCEERVVTVDSDEGCDPSIYP